MFSYYRLIPIDHALSGLSLERMKQQAALHGIEWDTDRLTYPQDYASDPHLIKRLWATFQTAPIGTIDKSLWQEYERRLLETSIHCSHGINSPGYRNFKSHVGYRAHYNEDGELEREVFANE